MIRAMQVLEDDRAIWIASPDAPQGIEVHQTEHPAAGGAGDAHDLPEFPVVRAAVVLHAAHLRWHISIAAPIYKHFLPPPGARAFHVPRLRGSLRRRDAHRVGPELLVHDGAA